MLKLAVDIGGTYMRMVLSADGQAFLADPQKIKTENFNTLESALREFILSQKEDPASITGIAVGRSGNSDWKVDGADMLAAFPNARILEVNDFEANALGLINPKPEELLHLGGEKKHPDTGATRAVVGSGTGLGLAYITAGGEVVKTHGGHMLPVLITEEQRDLSQELQKFKTNGTCPIYEDTLSGNGILNIYKVLSGHGHLDCEYRDTHQLMAEGRNNPIVQQTLKFYHEMLGLFAHQAIAFGGAYGGVFLTGGITDRLIGHNLFDSETFFSALYQKNVPRVSQDVRQTPVFWVKDEFISLKGLLGSV